MRTIVNTLAALAVILFTSPSMQAKDEYGHTLTGLWKTYYSALSADRPKQQAEALEAIKKEAAAKRLSWDYYDACTKYVDAVSSTDWKLRGSLRDACVEELLRYDDPVVTFYSRGRQMSDSDLAAFVESNKTRLQASCTREFHDNDGYVGSPVYAPVLRDLIRNDYEYARWSLFLRDWSGDSHGMEEFCGESYPQRAFVDFTMASRSDWETRRMAMEQYSLKYPGKAVSMLALQEILSLRFNELVSRKESSSDDFLALRKDCGSFISRRDGLSGLEKDIAACCREPENLIRSLEEKSLSFEIRDGELSVFFRNLQKAMVSIRREEKDKDALWTGEALNGTGSFYRRDTVRLPLPLMDDGEYYVCAVSGNIREEGRYTRHSLSFASRRTASGGHAIFVADYMTGQPVENVEVSYFDNKEKLVETASCVAMNGFTELPSRMEDRIAKGGSGMISVSFRDVKGFYRCSDRHHIYPQVEADARSEEELHCHLITDRTAFTPDETVHFKVVAYRGIHSLKAEGKGTELNAVLVDPMGRTVSSMGLVTNDMGSAAGEFVLARSKRNGYYTLRISDGRRTLTSESLRVDDFVLPTYELVWDRMEPQYLPLEEVKVGGVIRSYSGHNLSSARISYSVYHNGDDAVEGELKTDPAGRFSISIRPDTSDWQYYSVNVKIVDATGETKEYSTSVTVSRRPEPVVEKEYFFEDLKGNGPSVRVVAGQMKTWLAVELFGPDNRLLEHRLITFSPEGGSAAGTLVSFPYKPAWPDAVTLKLIYFQKSRVYSHSLVARREVKGLDVPLGFTRFLDTTAPGTAYSFLIKSAPGVECAATIFDKSTETVNANIWRAVRPEPVPEASVYYESETGCDHASSGMELVYGATKSAPRMMKMSVANAAMVETEAVMDSDSAVEEAAGAPSQDGYVRADFANTIAWEPFLRAGKDGSMELRFTNADKLSTYYVQLFAHDSRMASSVLRKEMVVTLPVQLSIVQPRLLYVGDSYTMKAVLSNSTDREVPGTFECVFFDGPDFRTANETGRTSEHVAIAAKGSVTMASAIEAPSVDCLGVKLSFTPDNGSYGADALFVPIPVRRPVQTITEAHSAVLYPDMDRSALLGTLQSLFTMADGKTADVRDISILQMLLETIPSRIEPKGNDILSLTDAVLVDDMLVKLGLERLEAGKRAEIESKILACIGDDGGVSWFAGMTASPVLTATVLGKLHGTFIPEEKMAAYLDKAFFNDGSRPFWCGGISMEQYLSARALCPELPFDRKGVDAARFKEFSKECKAYLTPSKARGLNGMILPKARRMTTIQSLLASDAGVALAAAWGIRGNTAKKLSRSLAADAGSIVEYARPYARGGYFFPNAVMPWRGLMESELYAHVVLCTLLDSLGHDEVADGIRLWMMLQKETQEWGGDPAFIQAMQCVLCGSEDLLDTRVLALSSAVEKPFAEIAATGNGFKVERHYFIGEREIDGGTEVHVGDEIRAEYRIWSEENRSFVRLTAWRPASLMPQNQLSGNIGWWLGPLRVNGWVSFRPQGYRNVLEDRTEYWFDSYPEQNTTVTETFHVTQEGRFQCPVTVVESLYAPHYRANDCARMPLISGN